MGRAPCCDKANVKKGPWSPEEDATLKSHIQKHGTGGNWIALPHKIGLKRCGKSCRLRWLNYLRPDIKHGAFTEDEDNLICTLYSAIGSRWSIIAAQLPGRTDNDIKNYWNTRLKKKLLGKQRRSLELQDHPPPQPLQPPTSDLPLILEPDLCYCNDYVPQQNILEPNLQQQNLWGNSACSSFQFMMDSSSINLEEGMYAANANAMAPQLDAAAITASSSSPLENVSWGDTNSNSVDSLIYPQQTLANYQHFTLFDDPRLLGFSQ